MRMEGWTQTLEGAFFQRPPFLRQTAVSFMPKEKVLAFASILKDGKFVDHPGTPIGKVEADGHIENTDYTYKKRKVIGGTAITKNSVLEADGEDLINPATGERFKKTRKGTGYFSSTTKTFIRPWCRQSDGGE